MIKISMFKIFWIFGHFWTQKGSILDPSTSVLEFFGHFRAQKNSILDIHKAFWIFLVFLRVWSKVTCFRILELAPKMNSYEKALPLIFHLHGNAQCSPSVAKVADVYQKMHNSGICYRIPSVLWRLIITLRTSLVKLNSL